MKSLPDILWNEIKKIIPKKDTLVGRPEIDNKAALNGIIYILYTGAQWSMLPEKYGNHKTVHGKFMRWARAGVFYKMMVIAREHYRKRNKKNNWYAFDTMSKKAPLANFSGKSPTDRGKRGVKVAILVDRKGAPLFVDAAPANQHDSKIFKPVVKNLRKSKNIKIIAADSAFDVKDLRTFCKQKNIALIASPNKRRKKNVHKFNVPYRWVVEQNFGCLSWFRGIKICWNKTYESFLSILQISCSLRIFRMSGILR